MTACRNRRLWRCFRAMPEDRADGRPRARSLPLPLVCGPHWSCVQTCMVPFLSAPLLLGLALRRRRVRVLHLEPIRRPAGAVGRTEPLRDDPLEAHLAGVAEDDRAIPVLQVLCAEFAESR